MIRIKIWSDFACPYCYIGERRLENAIMKLGLQDEVEIEYKAFELDPNGSKAVTLKTAERLAKKYGLSLEEAMKKVKEISALGKELGIDFRYEDSQYSNTFDAHRLMKLAEDLYDKETVARLNENLFSAYFTKGLVLANPEVLLNIGKESGLKEIDIDDVLATESYSPQVREDEKEASLLGVRGVPFMIFNDEFAIPGAISQEGFITALERAKNRQSNESGEKAHECGPEGCKVAE